MANRSIRHFYREQTKILKVVIWTFAEYFNGELYDVEPHYLGKTGTLEYIYIYDDIFSHI